MTFEKTCAVCGAPARFRLTAKSGRTPGGETATSEHRDAFSEHIDTVYEALVERHGPSDLRIYMDWIDEGHT